MKKFMKNIFAISSCVTLVVSTLMGCGNSEKNLESSGKVLLDMIIKDAFDTTDSDFFEKFGLDRDKAELESEKTNNYYLSESIVYKGKESYTIYVDFKEDGTFGSINYKFVFDEGSKSLKSAYDFMYACDMDFSKTYGTSKDQRALFFEKYSTYESLEEQALKDPESLIWGVADVYEQIDDDTKNISITIRGAETAAWVEIGIYKPTDRSLL